MNFVRKLKGITANSKRGLAQEPQSVSNRKKVECCSKGREELSWNWLAVKKEWEMKCGSGVQNIQERAIEEKIVSEAALLVEPTDDGPSGGISEEQIEKEMKETRKKEAVTRGADHEKNPTFNIGKGTEVGQVITCTVDGKDGKLTLSYTVERIIGSGSFGVVYQSVETNEVVAIKKVLQDKRFKNRELSLMRLLDHPNVCQLKHCFFSAEKKDVYLNLILEYVPGTIYSVSRYYSKRNLLMPVLYIQLYIYQICRALNYIHNVVQVCHCDIKPQNILVNPGTHEVKLCDFGSAKILLAGEPNISYICSRYYRAPELIFGATEYTSAIDIWSAGCVMAEILLGHRVFPGQSAVDQLVEIIKVLGTPSREEVKYMNPNCKEFNLPHIKANPWHKIFNKKYPPEAMDLVSRMLQYSPQLRFSPLEACAHPFFDDLRAPDACLPNGQPLPPLFDFTPQELAHASPEVRECLIPKHIRES